jgi:hypothetical protein
MDPEFFQFAVQSLGVSPATAAATFADPTMLSVLRQRYQARKSGQPDPLLPARDVWGILSKAKIDEGNEKLGLFFVERIPTTDRKAKLDEMQRYRNEMLNPQHRERSIFVEKTGIVKRFSRTPISNLRLSALFYLFFLRLVRLTKRASYLFAVAFQDLSAPKWHKGTWLLVRIVSAPGNSVALSSSLSFPTKQPLSRRSQNDRRQLHRRGSERSR